MRRWSGPGGRGRRALRGAPARASEQTERSGAPRTEATVCLPTVQIGRRPGGSASRSAPGRPLTHAKLARMIHREPHGPITVLRMDHGKANAMDVELLDGLSEALAEADASDAQALVLTGTGRIFSAGVDLFRVLDGGAEYLGRFLPALSRALKDLFAFPRPVVAALNGHAIAGGCILACACDHRADGAGSGRLGRIRRRPDRGAGAAGRRPLPVRGARDPPLRHPAPAPPGGGLRRTHVQSRRTPSPAAWSTSWSTRTASPIAPSRPPGASPPSRRARSSSASASSAGRRWIGCRPSSGSSTPRSTPSGPGRRFTRTSGSTSTGHSRRAEPRHGPNDQLMTGEDQLKRQMDSSYGSVRSRSGA